MSVRWFRISLLHRSMNFRGCLIADALPHNKRERKGSPQHLLPALTPPRQRLLYEAMDNAQCSWRAQATAVSRVIKKSLHKRHSERTVRHLSYTDMTYKALLYTNMSGFLWNHKPTELESTTQRETQDLDRSAGAGAQQTHCCQQKGARSLLQMCIKNAFLMRDTTGV